MLKILGCSSHRYCLSDNSQFWISQFLGSVEHSKGGWIHHRLILSLRKPGLDTCGIMPPTKCMHIMLGITRILKYVCLVGIGCIFADMGKNQHRIFICISR